MNKPIRQRASPDDAGELFAPNGMKILGTYEMIVGRAEIVRDSFRLDTKDGKTYLEFDYEGGTEVFWDGQETLRRAGQVVFLDEDGNEWTEAELIATLTGRPMPEAQKEPTPFPWQYDDVQDGSHPIRVFAEGREHHAKANNEADARLIAAAPDLLALLEKACRLMPRSTQIRAEWLRHAGAVIAKARGQS